MLILEDGCLCIWVCVCALVCMRPVIAFCRPKRGKTGLVYFQIRPGNQIIKCMEVKSRILKKLFSEGSNSEGKMEIEKELPKIRPCRACAALPPLLAECHAWGIQVGILHRLHLWAAQEVVKGVEGVRRPGHGLLGTGVACWTRARAHWAQALHVVHCTRHQVTWNEGEWQSWFYRYLW